MILIKTCLLTLLKQNSNNAFKLPTESKSITLGIRTVSAVCYLGKQFKYGKNSIQIRGILGLTASRFSCVF